MPIRLLFVLILAFALAGCARQVISRESLLLAERNLSFGAVHENPQSYVGRTLLVGGALAETANTPEGTELEVVQFPLGSDDRPREQQGSDGRFLARTRDFLDPLIYSPGRLVTLVGTVTGTAKRRLDGTDYRYPVIAIREIYIWRPEDPYAQPAVHFGIGVGVGF
jgi:outer membrane lipoprotein